MRCYYDLHVHSCLSPCAENDNTPATIVGTAKLNELDIIAIADHNTGGNLRAGKTAAEFYEILFLPAIEITTQEEVHLLAMFEDVDVAVKFGENIYDSLPNVKLREDIFGEQLQVDEEDNIIGKPEKLLINACGYSIDSLVKMIRKAGGVPVPAHINKPADSIMASLGFVPAELNIKTVELHRNSPLDGVDLLSHRMIYSSDAHRPGDIATRENYLNLKELSPGCLLEKLESEV